MQKTVNTFHVLHGEKTVMNVKIHHNLHGYAVYVNYIRKILPTTQKFMNE